MSTKSEVTEFLTTRRARLKPAEAGITNPAGRRRVPGLRREEVAMLAGVSVDYYVQLERGELSGASESVLDSVAKALQLDDAERDHLFDLARNTNTLKRRRPAPKAVRPGVQQFLDSITTAPAWIQNGRLDILAANTLGHALYADMFASSTGTVNAARHAFLTSKGEEFWLDWDKTADEFVAVLRAEAGRNPYDRALTDLIGELATRSDDFRIRWASHNVAKHGTGLKRIHHPVVGELELRYEAMTLVADPGLTLSSYSAEPGSPTAQRLSILTSWAATEGIDLWRAAADEQDQRAHR